MAECHWLSSVHRISICSSTLSAHFSCSTPSRLRRNPKKCHVKDQGGEMFCLGPKHAGQCSSPDFAPIAHQFCAKTCGLCQ
ncbi:hypothetical protein OSTOST_14833 [Ostertagia ostertagi]